MYNDIRKIDLERLEIFEMIEKSLINENEMEKNQKV